MVMPTSRTTAQAQTSRDVAAALRSSNDDVCQRWIELAHHELGVEDHQAEQLLGGSVGHVLDAAANTLDGRPEAAIRDGDEIPATADDTREPAADRMLAAYSLLRRAAVEQLTKALGRDLRSDEVIELCAAVDSVMARRLVRAVEKPVRELRNEAELQAAAMSLLSHDLRGTLNGIVLMLEVLRRDLQGRPEHAENLEDLSMVRQSIAEMAGLLERHALLYRLQQRRVHVQREPIALRELVEDEAKGFAQPAKAKGVELVIDIAPEVHVQADRMLLATAIQNLLDNAMKHGTPGPVRVTADQRGTDGKDVWVLSVTDSGPGIAPERLEVLLDPSRRMQKKERGLGLLIVVYAGRLAGAKVEAVSTPGVGSSFRLLLPEAEPG